MSMLDPSRGPKQMSGDALPDTEPPARLWDKNGLEADSSFFFYDLSQSALNEMSRGLDFAEKNGLTAEIVEQEDFRIPAFACDVPDLRERLDTGRGFVVIRGVDASALTEAQAEILAWILCNYLGRPIRQGISHDRRFFTVADKGSANTDPTRIGASPKRSAKHSDNGCLEPRPPEYLGLFCYRSATEGGDSTIVSARTIYEIISRERPNILPFLFKTYHFRAPQAHVWPSRGPTVQKPIFDISDGELRIAYARVMIEPGMEMAGTPLSDEERDVLDYFDQVIERPEANFRYVLRPGELLVMNNRVLLHGREPFPAGMSGGRMLKRFWMWRRHIGPGDDPALLDIKEFV